MTRLYNLDYLRGLAAFGIMIFHFFSWSFGEYSSHSLMGRLGLYGVSVFYVLSGLTLWHVYFPRSTFTRSEMMAFVTKRVYRIFPLLWLVTILSILASRKTPDGLDLFLNLSGLFGFLKWDAYFSPGVWSIGNELVFYAFFPIFVILTKRNRPAMVALSLAIAGLYGYFAFARLDANLPLEQQWKNYINPLNQVFLFLGGFLIGLFLSARAVPNWINAILLGVAFALMTFTPAQGDRIHLVTGLTRLLLTLSCFLICAGFFKLDLRLPALLHKPLVLLGEASYSVYLLHPLVFGVVRLVLSRFHAPVWVTLATAIAASLLGSYFVYEYFEKWFMKLGRNRSRAYSAKTV
jgi:peptidoglycan/LPS O-acetylase OafA/YrhL